VIVGINTLNLFTPSRRILRTACFFLLVEFGVNVWRTTDDRDHAARLTLLVWPRGIGGTARVTFRSAARVLIDVLRARLFIVPMLAAGAVVMIALAVVKGGPWILALFSFSPVLSISLLLVFAGLVSFSDSITEHKERLKTRRLRDGQCPACGYDVAEIDADADGCVVCPECGGAWRMSRLSDPPRVVIRN
jgi:hypothetical protein